MLSMLTIRFDYRALVSLSVLLVMTVHGRNQPMSKLELVSAFDHQATGVSIHRASGRVFLNFPRWTEDAPVSVAELIAPNVTASFPPNSNWNSWRNTRANELDPTKYFVCVQSVVVSQDSLFVLDAAAPAMGPIIRGGPKLVEIDLMKNEVKRAILLDEDMAPQGSYLNDVRFSPDGKFAYITDSGAVGAIIVVNLETEKIKRVLHGHPTTQADTTVTVQYEGKPLRGPDGNGVDFSADGIELSIDGSILYWQAIRGKTLYSIPTSGLRTGESDQKLATQITTIGENGPADGFWMSSAAPHLLYVSSIQDDSVRVRNLLTNTYEVELTDSRLRWPDTFSEDAQGYIYVTASHIPDSAVFKAGAPTQLRTELWRFRPSQH